MLRNWQAESVSLAVENYLSGKRHFQVQATPGAGKTVMAAEVAKRLLEADEIDLVLCFSPSLTIAQGIQGTFAWKLNCGFHGGLGALGASFTYQSMKYQKESFWSTLQKYRVLAVFDELHHCSGDELENANVWGEQILSQISGIAKYTLGLTGTPWRSDLMPITLVEYIYPDGDIKCDYQYGLKQAIRDNVCRAPKIVLVDNDQLSVSDDGETKNYSSILELLKQSSVSYQNILHNKEAMTYLLGLGCQKLKEIRYDNPNAGGLVVAASVKHAIDIQKILSTVYNQSTEIVTYHHDKPLDTIDQFRHGDTQWIISVGMISEGTDIPRLQVCCHLSAVKTELYFRQVLGRVLRTNDALNQQAWLYTFAEESLVAFAEEIEKDIPDSCLYIKADKAAPPCPGDSTLDTPSTSEPKAGKPPKQEGDLFWGPETPSPTPTGSNTTVGTTPNPLTGLSEINLGQFRERVIAAFLTL
ncbi:DEAD/DEAH box helicase family protein [Vibrio sp. JC009]|uniref:DEAD/DEAH box helicase n=1 Tax=Vibrio sp. JC009 TaxID=2912314 RepID=UPI0023B080FB|nr:DEAD/DEAH box helicase family protein [Vibrio sp. JC009]WED21566.1 DEAD/DEAH box helicase family protein [Vibrio sp. JC009]